MTHIILFNDFIKFSLKAHTFFLIQRSLRNLNPEQYDLTYMVHLENIDQLFSKEHVGNSIQDSIWLYL